MPEEDVVARKIQYSVSLQWSDGTQELITNVMAWKFEEEFYFFFVRSLLDDSIPAIRNVWAKNPDLRYLKIIPEKFID